MVDVLWDVLIYEIETRRVDAIVGRDMRYDTGYHNAQRRLMTALGRINTHYSACIVAAGTYEKGDVLAEEGGHGT